MWKVTLTKNAKKQLAKLDKNQARLLVEWMEKNLEGCENPRSRGKSLEGDKPDLWRYRVGRYRILVTLKDGLMIVQVVQVGHRQGVYKK